MSDDNVIPFNQKQSPPEDVYERIYNCLEAAYLGSEHNCAYCNQNHLIAKMVFEILMSELIAISKKTKLQFSTFDAKLILNKISERISTLEQEMVEKQEATGAERQREIRGLESREQETPQTDTTTTQGDGETSET